MNVENLKCGFLKLEPQAFENGYNTGILKELQITASYNKGTEVTKNINLVTLANTWSAVFLHAASTYVKQVYARNIFTNQLFPLLANPILYTQGNLTAFDNYVEGTLKNTLNIPTASVVTNTLGTITVTGLPYNIVMDSIVTTLLTVEQATSFGFISSPDVIINSNCIYLKPSFFGLTVFPDGVYTISAIVTTTDNMLIEERSCVFVDCSFGAVLAKLTDAAACDTHSMHLLLMHYALTQGSNNACSCDDMYAIFDYLAQNINQEILEDCGCN